MDKDKALREHILELLEGRSAHIDLGSALNDFPISGMNERAGGSPHTPWELLEHIRIAQRDILDFCRDPNYRELSWPDDHWPKQEGTVESWNASVRQVFEDLQAMRELVSATDVDLYAEIPHGSGQTILREAMLVADHNSYHLGQLVMLRRMSDAKK